MCMRSVIVEVLFSKCASPTVVARPATLCSRWKFQSFVRRSSSYRPGYNHGLSGKAKSKRSNLGVGSLPDTQGEVLFGLHPAILALQAKKRETIHCIFMDKKFTVRGHDDSPVGHILSLASKQNIPVQPVTRKVLDQLAGNRPHQGVCMDVEQLKIPEWSEQDVLARNSDVPLWLLLHNIQDPMNFGAILRTAYYLGLDRVVVPSMNSCKPSPVVSKASAGAMEIIDLVKLPESTPETQFCKWWQSHGGEVVGTGADPSGSDRSVLLEKFSVTRPTMLILGNEGTGVGKELEDCCDRILSIPGHEPINQATSINSLNVSVAAGILLHWIKTSCANQR